MVIKLRKILYLVLASSMFFQQIGFAQMTAELSISGYLSGMSSSAAVEKFRPLHLRYLEFNPSNEGFKLLVDKGNTKDLDDPAIVESTKDLMTYFFVGLTLPDDSFWVNLRPDSEDQIIDGYLEKTDVGKIMLEADLQLKKDISAMTSPATPEGREYWNKLYKKAEELYGYDNVTIPTLIRPWIVPGEIIVRESKESAYVYKANLKVMLEQDYLKNSTTYNFKDERLKSLNEYSCGLIRELIIPKLTREVNSAKRYAGLRQVYYSLILSRWFKLRFTGKTGNSASLINTRNLTGLISKEPCSKTDYFKQYQKSFAEGEYNIKEPVYTPTGQVIRSYFSGGLALVEGMLPSSGNNNLAGMFTNTSNPVIPNDPNNVMLEAISSTDQIDPETVSDEVNPVAVQAPEETVVDPPMQTPNRPDGPRNHPSRRSFIKKAGALLSLGGISLLLQSCYAPNPYRPSMLGREEARRFVLPHFRGTFRAVGDLIVRELDGPFYRFTYTGGRSRAVLDTGGDTAIIKIELEYHQDVSSAEYLNVSGDFDPTLNKIGVQLIYDIYDKDSYVSTEYSNIVVTGDIKPHLISVPLSKLNPNGASLWKVRGVVLYMGHRIVTRMALSIIPPIPGKFVAEEEVMGNPTGSGFTLTDIEFRDASSSVSGLQNETVYQNEPAVALPIEPVIAASSTVGSTPEKTGGIDFKTLLMAIQTMGSFSSLNFELPQLSKAQLAQINIDSELQQIESMIISGILPSGQRIKELVAACVQKKEISARADNFLLCLMDIYKLEEENAYESSAELRESLVIVDTLAS